VFAPLMYLLWTRIGKAKPPAAGVTA
jgi:hypothetical protein